MDHNSLSMARALSAPLRMPFDLARQQYASAVLAGFMPRSMLACAQHERMVHTMESMALGPLARTR